MKEFITNIFGHNNAAYWAAALFFGLVGFVFYKWVTYNPNSKKTSPNVFSWKYWISNNTSDMLGGTLTFFIWVRFKEEIFEAFNNDSVSQWLVSFTDTFFVHMMFGVLSIDIIRRVRKVLKK